SGQALASWLGSFREVRDEIRRQPGKSGEKPREAKGRPAEREGGEEEDAEECAWPGFLALADDVNLQLGRLRLRPSGSAGGHNGLKDIEKALGGRDYPRLRLGVGAPPEKMDRVDYVLGRFSPAEMSLAETSARTAAVAVADWISLGMDAARDRHTGPIR
ncbi:MAG: aminoacyl-tRNA hydrolase, partial [Planctomycetota bacterium]|nr:aminoacyl-tRNA hydrolase [Planctomycetota bacterium]